MQQRLAGSPVGNHDEQGKLLCPLCTQQWASCTPFPVPPLWALPHQHKLLGVWPPLLYHVAPLPPLQGGFVSPWAVTAWLPTESEANAVWHRAPSTSHTDDETSWGCSLLPALETSSTRHKSLPAKSFSRVMEGFFQCIWTQPVTVLTIYFLPRAGCLTQRQQIGSQPDSCSDPTKPGEATLEESQRLLHSRGWLYRPWLCMAKAINKVH